MQRGRNAEMVESPYIASRCHSEANLRPEVASHMDSVHWQLGVVSSVARDAGTPRRNGLVLFQGEEPEDYSCLGAGFSQLVVFGEVVSNQRMVDQPVGMLSRHQQV